MRGNGAPHRAREIAQAGAHQLCRSCLEEIAMLVSSHRHFSLHLIAICCGLLVVACAGGSAIAKEIPRGVVVGDSLPAAYRVELARKLQAISGWPDIAFDRDGNLRVTSTRVRGGSASARGLLTSALEGKNLILLEGSSSRADVVFCRVELTHWAQPEANKPTTYRVVVDFSDFKHVGGDKEARAAFDIGWAVLHELEHVVNNSKDADLAADDGGDCEATINRMRTELGLAIRKSYYFTFLPLKTDLDLITKFVRLPFERRDPSSSKVKRYWLIWDAALVGGAATIAQTASLQSSNASK